jgi:hypothetical protein
VATIFAVRQEAPSPPAVVSAPDPATAAARHPASWSQSDAITQHSSPAIAPASSNLLLNFAAFQTHFTDPQRSDAERSRSLRPLLGQSVVWKGFVDAVTPLASPTVDAAMTVSLVESSEKLGQSLFKTPAHFRFGSESLDAVSRLVPGDVVTLSGTLTEHSLIASIVVDAHLVTVNGLPAARVLAAPETAAPR